MNIAEILRGLADKIDGVGNDIPHQDQSAQLHPAQAQHDENPEVNTDSMVSPLQQKLELLKKAAGEDSMYDDGEGVCPECGQDPCACEHGEEDPLDVMKKMAGLPVAIQVSAEDNDIEG
jgi:hypothetical protein